MKRDIVNTRLTVGFSPVVMSLIRILANERGVSEGELIQSAIVATLNDFDVVGDIKALAGAVDINTYTAAAKQSGDFDPLQGAVVHRSVTLRFASPADICLDKTTAERLIRFCTAAKLSRAWSIRMAVDRYLFYEVTNTEFGTVQILDNPAVIDRTYSSTESAQQSEHQA
ncbi:hypothetical protein [Nocardia sp. NPDC049149]|uniref:hypothetical protein n=1 Tax=Nocardia sp. NPDC049149 TaxID=3364315 RepID=UPI003718259F